MLLLSVVGLAAELIVASSRFQTNITLAGQRSLRGKVSRRCAEGLDELSFERKRLRERSEGNTYHPSAAFANH